jgi:phasin family protein
MANAPQSFMDLSKLMPSVEPTKMIEEFSKLMGQYKLPGVDVESVMAAQKKNMDALIAANRTALEGLQTMMKRQSEIMQETLAEAQKAVSGMGKSGSSPQEMVAAQAEFAKTAFERGLHNMRELAEMIAKSQTEAANVINQRISAQLQEMRDSVLKMKAGS